jgi:diadenosine tetraphosphate (Ap4A) HIT family hydrolase
VITEPAKLCAVVCVTCRSLAGEVVLTNGPRLELDDHWRVEHAHPVAVAGWLVLVLRRHARALHDLTEDEATALGRWLAVLPKALHHATGSEVEYVMQFAEGEGFHHVHVHLIARTARWNPDWKGPGVFGALDVDEPVSAERTTRVVHAVGAFLGITPVPVTP